MPIFHSEPCFCGRHNCAPHIRSGIQSTTDYICTFQVIATMAAEDPEIINILDEEDEGDDDWQDVGPINIKEAAAYKEKVDEIFETMFMMLTDDQKDAIHVTITAFKKLTAKHWAAMKDVDVEVVV